MTDLNVYFSKERFVDGLNDLLNENRIFEGTIVYHMCPVDGEYIHIADWNVWINVEGCGNAAIMGEISKEMIGFYAFGRVRDSARKQYLTKKGDWSI